jgi:hypothetical protein
MTYDTKIILSTFGKIEDLIIQQLFAVRFLILESQAPKNFQSRLQNKFGQEDLSQIPVTFWESEIRRRIGQSKMRWGHEDLHGKHRGCGITG